MASNSRASAKETAGISIKDFLKTLGAGYAGYINAKHVHKLGTVKTSKPEGKFVSFVPANSNGYVKIEFTLYRFPK